QTEDAPEPFIGAEERPDLSSSALSEEKDQQQLRDAIQQGSPEAKRLYDSPQLPLPGLVPPRSLCSVMSRTTMRADLSRRSAVAQSCRRGSSPTSTSHWRRGGTNPAAARRLASATRWSCRTAPCSTGLPSRQSTAGSRESTRYGWQRQHSQTT